MPDVPQHVRQVSMAAKGSRRLKTSTPLDGSMTLAGMEYAGRTQESALQRMWDLCGARLDRMLRHSCAGSSTSAASSPFRIHQRHAAVQRVCRSMQRHQLRPAALYGRRTDDDSLTGAAGRSLHACAPNVHHLEADAVRGVQEGRQTPFWTRSSSVNHFTCMSCVVISVYSEASGLDPHLRPRRTRTCGHCE